MKRDAAEFLVSRRGEGEGGVRGASVRSCCEKGFRVCGDERGASYRKPAKVNERQVGGHLTQLHPRMDLGSKAERHASWERGKWCGFARSYLLFSLPFPFKDINQIRKGWTLCSARLAAFPLPLLLSLPSCAESAKDAGLDS